MPDDFAQFAFAESQDQLRKRYSTGSAIITRWRTELKPDRVREKQAPADFLAKAKTLNRAQLQSLYGVGERMIVKWIKATGASPPLRIHTRPSLQRPVPADFVEMAKTMSRKGLTKHYRTSLVAVNRWCAESGSEPVVRPVRQPVPKVSSPRPFKFHSDGHVHRDLRRTSMYDEAADVLRRRFVVFRCGPTGKFLVDGLHWRVGNVICTPDELMQRAAKYRERAA